MRVSSSGSRLPQLTPMRTGLRWRQAISIISANCGSRLLPRPTLPGLMRSFASASAQAGCIFRSLWPLKWKSPTSGTVMPACARRSRMCGTAAAASSVLTVTRTISEPARARARTCATVASMSAVSVLVIDCTTIGASPPTFTPPTTAWMLRRRRIIGPAPRQGCAREKCSRRACGAYSGRGTPILPRLPAHSDLAGERRPAARPRRPSAWRRAEAAHRGRPQAATMTG